MTAMFRGRTAIATASGLLIVVGLVSGYFAPHAVISDVAMVAAAVIAGFGIARRALTELWSRRVGIELLVTIAVTGALVIGEYWEAAAVTFLFVLGAVLEAATLGRTRKAVGQLLDLTPTVATVIRAGQQVVVDAYDVAVSELVLVKAGARVPVDGVVVAGHAAIDEASITGESMPVEKSPGDHVFAGTVIAASGTSTVLQVRATGTGDDTTLARIIDRVEQAQESKAPAQRTMERFASWYTPLVVVLAVVVYAATREVELALTLLVIACPGALVISMPVTYVAGIGRAARRGILVKGGQHLEAAAGITAVALDKTGTITTGKPNLVHRESFLTGGDSGEVLRWAAIAETGSEHPLAAPILTAARQAGITLPAQVPAVTTFPGGGVTATWQGQQVLVGNANLMVEHGIEITDSHRQAIGRQAGAGRTPILVAVDNRVLGLLAVADTVRTDAATSLARLTRLGVTEVAMLTGDDPAVANVVAAEVGIGNVQAALLPEAKLDAIAALQQRGHRVAMIGDGVNDAPALAHADIGVAMGGTGAAVAVETADVALMTDDLGRLAELIYLARRTRNVLIQNVTLALLTVGALIGGVLFAGTTMAQGMLIHEVSVLIVVLNAVRLLRVNTAPRGVDRQAAELANVSPQPVPDTVTV